MAQLKMLHRNFLNFVWNNASHRITSSVLLAPRLSGGLGAPDLIKYFYATHLRAISSWTSQYAPNSLSEKEMGITVPAHPCCMLWLSSDKCIPQQYKICLNPMLFTLLIWKRCSSKYSLSSPCSPLVNILFNTEIPDSLSYDSMLPWTQAGIFQLRHLVHPVTRKLLSFSDLQSKHKIPKTLFYSFLQIKHFFITRTPQITL